MRTDRGTGLQSEIWYPNPWIPYPIDTLPQDTLPPDTLHHGYPTQDILLLMTYNHWITYHQIAMPESLPPPPPPYTTPIYPTLIRKLPRYTIPG